MSYLFYHQNKWRLHPGELPVKPDFQALNEDHIYKDYKFYTGYNDSEILEQYNAAIADIKEKSLEVENPEIVKKCLAIRYWINGDVMEDRFYKWPGSYEKKSNQVSRGVFVEVAHLVLPPEE